MLINAILPVLSDIFPIIRSWSAKHAVTTVIPVKNSKFAQPVTFQEISDILIYRLNDAYLLKATTKTTLQSVYPVLKFVPPVLAKYNAANVQ